MKSTLKWKPATTIYPTDHIISSKAREVGAIGFKPQYENVKHVNIRFLLSNEYMRLWFKERELYQKENYAKREKAQNESNLNRGFVQRMMVYPKQVTRELPKIQIKRFQNIMSKVESGKTSEEKTKLCERFRRTVQPVELLRYKPACSIVKQKILAQKGKKPNTKQISGSQKENEKTEGIGKNCQFVCKIYK